MQRRLLLLAGAGALLATALWLWRLCDGQSQISFLPRHAPAEWLVYPKPAVPYLQAVAELPTVFRRSFALGQVPTTATLSVRACRRCVISINGRNVALPAASANWKEPQVIPASAYLRAGENSITVTVVNHLGPPALWLSLSASGLRLNSDASWQTSYAGAVWEPAQLAAQPAPAGPGNPLRGGERPLPSTQHQWTFLLAAMLLSLAVVLGGNWWFKWTSSTRSPLPSRWQWTAYPPALLFVALSILWLFLFTHNLGLVPRSAGFDSLGHLEYIRYVQEHAALPLAPQGWEMHQPPLYYVLCAAVLNCLRLSASSFDGLAVLRVLALVFGLIHLALVGFSLRLLFPNKPSSQLAGLALAGFLPMQLYLTHYVTNETLAACLMSATLYVALKLVGKEQASWRLYLALGLCLGLSLLAKVTALIVAPFALAALVYAAVRRGSSPSGSEGTGAGEGGGQRPGRWVFPLLSVLVCVAVCGWHYWRVWRHFGHAFFVPTRWAYGVTWWQDPGYHTAAYFTRFGRALTAPFFSGLSSFADGLYTTLWGDGLCGGASALLYRPPWNYELMAAGFLLALVPGALILTGFVVSVVRLVRQPDARSLGLLGFGVALLLAIVHLNLEVPAYAEAKAVFGLAALIPLCAFAASGWDFVAQKAGRLAVAAAILLSGWAMTSYASFWIRGESATTRAALGRALMNEGNFAGALVHLESALQSEPGHIAARSFLVATLLKQNRLTDAALVANDAVRDHPEEALCQLDLAAVLEKQLQLTAALDHARRAVELASDHADARLRVASLRFRLQRHGETITACREALRLAPADPELHFLLASSLVAASRQPAPSLSLSNGETLPSAPSDSFSPNDILTGEAINHFHFCLRLAPDTLDALNHLAWILATYPRAELRNGPEAVRLAQRACALTDNKSPSELGTLAAAYAETGQFQLAVETAQKAEKLADPSGNDAVQARNHRLLELFREQRPYRQSLPVSR